MLPKRSPLRIRTCARNICLFSSQVHGQRWLGQRCVFADVNGNTILYNHKHCVQSVCTSWSQSQTLPFTVTLGLRKRDIIPLSLHLPLYFTCVRKGKVWLWLWPVTCERHVHTLYICFGPVVVWVCWRHAVVATCILHTGAVSFGTCRWSLVQIVL